MNTRRNFFKNIAIISSLVILKPRTIMMARNAVRKHTKAEHTTIYRALNGTPELNLSKVIDLMGGIEKLFGHDDIIVIKPNLQWWNQGAPNLVSLKTFVDLIMELPGGFNGEVIVADNCHRGSNPWESNSSAWAHNFEWNSDIPNVKNMNELSQLLKEQYGDRYSTCHWIDVNSGNKRVFKPSDGVGYVYCDGTNGVPLVEFDNNVQGENHRATIMTYPIFSSDKGTVIDFKNGIWEKGSYIEQPLRYVNFAALNHHSTYCGITSAIKNYLGVSDLSGGPDPHNGGHLTKKYYNFHSFPFNKWDPGPKPGMLGAEIGVFLNTIRRADLNITTAEWIGLASRTEPPMAHTRAVLASTDPVALDYHAAKYILYPNSNISIHNPDDENSPTREYLMKCAEHGGGIFDEQFVGIKSYDPNSNSFQKDDKLEIIGEKKWGSNIKTIMKYFLLRYNLMR